jgi:hypothetical protein
MIQQIIKRRYFLVISRFASVFLHSSKVAAVPPPVLALYRISRSEVAQASQAKLGRKIFTNGFRIPGYSGRNV